MRATANELPGGSNFDTVAECFQVALLTYSLIHFSTAVCHRPRGEVFSTALSLAAPQDPGSLR